MQCTAIYSIVWRNRKDINETNSKLKDRGMTKEEINIHDTKINHA